MFQRHNIRPSFYYCMKKEMGHDNFDYIAIENKRNKKSFIFLVNIISHFVSSSSIENFLIT